MRQGCPLSPVLFNIVLEFLARAIRQEEEIAPCILQGSEGELDNGVILVQNLKTEEPGVNYQLAGVLGKSLGSSQCGSKQRNLLKDIYGEDPRWQLESKSRQCELCNSKILLRRWCHTWQEKKNTKNKQN
jgi:hypothetical protein